MLLSYQRRATGTFLTLFNGQAGDFRTTLTFIRCNTQFGRWILCSERRK